MTVKTIAVLSCLFSLTGAAARAQVISWTADPVVQLRATMAAETRVIAAPAAVAVKKAPVPASLVLTAQPYGSDELREPNSHGDNVYLSLNKDRVWATYTNHVHGDYPYDEITFLFPQLTVDRQAKVVKFGEETVATIGGFWTGVRLVKGWSLVSSRKEELVGTGWSRYAITRVSVTLEKR